MRSAGGVASLARGLPIWTRPISPARPQWVCRAGGEFPWNQIDRWARPGISPVAWDSRSPAVAILTVRTRRAGDRVARDHPRRVEVLRGLSGRSDPSAAETDSRGRVSQLFLSPG